MAMFVFGVVALIGILFMRQSIKINENSLTSEQLALILNLNQRTTV
jgi:hypothetical protein